jgi:hypothetical protein
MGWLSGWSYRKNHTINGATGAGTGYQIPITAHYGSGTDSGGDVYLNSNSRTDFGDVRFTSSDGTTLLNYWMQEVSSGNYAIFWVKIADDLGSSVTIYIYYGNSGATTTSNGANTFLFFDDFPGTTLDTTKWTQIRGSVSVSSSIVTMDGSTDGQELNSVWTDGGISYAVHLRAKKTYVTNQRWMGIWVRDQNYTSYAYSKGFFFAYDSTSNYIYLSTGSGLTTLDTGTPILSFDTWYVIQIIVNGTTYSDSAHGLSATNSTYASGHIGLGPGLQQTMYVDWIFVRKYVSPEPSNGTWGPEQTQFMINNYPYIFVLQGESGEYLPQVGF